MSRFLQKSAIIQSIWTSPRMRSEGFLFMSADLGVELCLPTVVLRCCVRRRLQVRRRSLPSA